MHARLHGACIGAGIEMTAFAKRVVARDDAFFALPEVGFGLVPGAGGTVSIPRRIGTHRTALLGLSGQRIDAALALDQTAGIAKSATPAGTERTTDLLLIFLWLDI